MVEQDEKDAIAAEFNEKDGAADVQPDGPLPFAKLFTHPDRGQLLVKLDNNEHGCPEVRVYCRPANLGVCSAAFAYEDSDRGWDAAEKVFESFDMDKCLETSSGAFTMSDRMGAAR